MGMEHIIPAWIAIAWVVSVLTIKWKDNICYFTRRSGYEVYEILW